MRPIIVDMKDMSESTEAYETRPHPFFAAFIYILAATLLAAVLWMCFFKIDVVVKATGIVRPETSVGTITNIVGGKVVDVCVREGESVKEGDVLYTIDVSDVERQKGELEESYTGINNKIAMMELYLQVLQGKKTDLSAEADNPYFEEYKNRLALVKSNYNSVGLDINSGKGRYSAAIDSYENSISYYNSQIETLSLAKSSVSDGVNYLDESSGYNYLIVKNYFSGCDSLKAQYDEQIKIQTEAGASNDSIKELSAKKDSALESLKLETLAEIEKQISQIEATQISLNNSLNEAETDLGLLDSGSYENGINNIKTTEISAVNSELETYKSKKKELESNIKSLEENISNATVTAKMPGTVNLAYDIVKGNYMDAGIQVMTIVPENNDGYVVEGYIENSDIGKLENGQGIKYEISSYPSSKYGNVTGELTYISPDIAINNEEGNAYYIVKGNIEIPEAGGRGKEQIELKAGMTCELKVVTGEKSVMRYLLEKLSLWD